MPHLNVIDLVREKVPPDVCPYLPEERASLDYRIVLKCRDSQYGEFLRRGWRRHGVRFFRPECPGCDKCLSLRVVVKEFQPTKSQRRCLRKNAHVKVVIQPPNLTDEHMRLFHAYHEDMAERRGWERHDVDGDDFYHNFLTGGYEFAREFLYYRRDRLLAVGLVDAIPEALSSVYFFHDPAWRSDGPGTFSILTEIEHARRSGCDHLYMGYWIGENQSMRYKTRFKPHEILERYPADDEEPVWRVGMENAG